MVENMSLNVVISLIFGFVITYLVLEVVWHFTACRLHEVTTIKPCLFKQVRTLIVGSRMR
jgi:hypothetical protein